MYRKTPTGFRYEMLSRNFRNYSSSQLGAWNPLDDWIWLDKPFLVEVLERIGPIYIDDYQNIYDVNETANFKFRFSCMGSKTCVSIDWDDGSKLQFFGNIFSCKLRYPVQIYFLSFNLMSKARLFSLISPPLFQYQKKSTSNQPYLLFHEILHLREPLVGSLAFYFILILNRESTS